MNTKDFISKVIAEKDNYLLCLIRNKKSTWHENYATLDELCTAIAVHDKTDLTVYIAVGSFANNVGPHETTGRDYTQRKAHQATWFRALAADLDVDPDNPKKYASQKEAVRTILMGCKKLDIPAPMIVLSGNGVHVWWPLTEDITATAWERLSLALRAALTAVGVKYDSGKISDPSMVLRPVGAHHKKSADNWKEVSLGIDRPATDPRVFAKALSKYDGLVTNRRPARKNKKKASKLMESLMSAGPPIILDDMRKCPQLAAILGTNGATDAEGIPVPEPFWRATLGIAKFCEDPEAAAIELSKGHPDYDEAACLDKLNAYTGDGPPLCKTLEAHCPEACASCEHYPNLNSPASLTGGVEVIETEDPDTGEVAEVKLPKGYTRKGNTLFFTHPTSGEEIFVAPYAMWIVARVTDAEENTNYAKIRVQFPQEGEKEISIESSIIAVGGKELQRALSDKQVYIKGNIDPLRNYLMTYLTYLQKQAAADVSYSHFGWQKDGTYLWGEKLIGTKRETHVHLEGMALSLVDAQQAVGSHEKWKKASRVWDHPGLEFQNFAVSLAIGAPLIAGTTIKAALVNLYGKSGSGKSLAGKAGLSAWGHPDSMMGHAKDTANSHYKKLGTLSNHGGYIDEMTTTSAGPLKTEVMTLQDGKEKDRLLPDASGLRPAAKWRMPVITSTNKDVYDVLKEKMNTGAEELRLLQLTCPRMDIFTKGTQLGRKLDDLLDTNYGHVGPQLVAEVISRGGSKVVMDAARKSAETEFGIVTEGDERFYEVMLLVAYAGGKLATELGLIGYDYMIGVRAVIEEIEHLRVSRVAETLDGFDTISQFLTENQDKVVYHHASPTRSFVLQPTPREGVARVELVFDDDDKLVGGMIFINRKAYRDWCTETGAQYRDTVAFLIREGVAVNEAARVTVFKGVPGAAATGQTYGFSLDIMSHVRLMAAHSNPETSEMTSGRKRLEVVGDA